MLIDHFGRSFFRSGRVLRMIGRLSMPIWAFFIAQGALKTHSPANTRCVWQFLPWYRSRAMIWARFGQLWETSMQNVGVTLLLGLLACYFASWCTKGKSLCPACPPGLPKGAFTPAVCFLLTAGVIVLSMFTRSDYGVFGVLAILMFYLFGDNLAGLFFPAPCPISSIGTVFWGPA